MLSVFDSWKQNVYHDYLLERISCKQYMRWNYLKEFKFIDTILGNKTCNVLCFLLERMNVLRRSLETKLISEFVS